MTSCIFCQIAAHTADAVIVYEDDDLIAFLDNRPIRRAAAIGTLEIIVHADHIYVGEFYLLPAWQRRGLGSQLLREVVAGANSEHLPIRLQFLKINPVRSLYERFGFRIIGETETHYLAERPLPDGLNQ